MHARRLKATTVQNATSLGPMRKAGMVQVVVASPKTVDEPELPERGAKDVSSSKQASLVSAFYVLRFTTDTRHTHCMHISHTYRQVSRHTNVIHRFTYLATPT